MKEEHLRSNKRKKMGIEAPSRLHKAMAVCFACQEFRVYFLLLFTCISRASNYHYYSQLLAHLHVYIPSIDIWFVSWYGMFYYSGSLHFYYSQITLSSKDARGLLPRP